MCPVGGALFHVERGADETSLSAMQSEWCYIGFWLCIRVCNKANIALEQTMKARKRE